MTELAITARAEPAAASSMAAAAPTLSLAQWRLPQLAASALHEAALTLSLARWGLPSPTLTLTVDQLTRSAALGLALLAHATVLYMLARAPLDPMAGGGGQQLDTISVTIVSSNVLEAREAERVQPSAAAAAATVEATDGASSSAAAAERHEEKTERKERNSEQQKPVEEPVLAREGITQAPQPAQRQRQANATAAAAGGAAARSDSASDAKPSAAAAAASAGAVREYARYVALALAKTKPKGVGGLGTVRIKFSIAADGALTAAEIAKSSGSKRLDDLALEAVRRAAFPLPPRGMSAAQLSYEVPYHFR